MRTRWDSVDDIAAEDVESYKRAATTPESAADFAAWTVGLPLEAMPGLGPHSLPALRDVIDTVWPMHILEIGFGAGASSTMFLHLTDHATVHSVDKTTDPIVTAAAAHMTHVWSGRFRFLPGDSRRISLPAIAWDLIFIDGDHELSAVVSDLEKAKALGIPWVLVDGWWLYLGPGVRLAVETQEDLQKVRQWGNLVLFRRVVTA